MLGVRGIMRGEFAQVGRNAGIGAGEIGADDLPVVAAVARLEQHVAAEIQRVRVGRRKQQGRGAVEIVFPRAQYDGRNILGLVGDAVIASRFAAINNVGIEWVGGDVAVFLGADRNPIAEGDFPVIAAAGGSHRAALLLSAINPVRKLIVGNDVVELRRGLVVPGAPGRATIDAERRALVAAEKNDFWIGWVDPDAVIVVASRSAFDRGEILAGI